MKYVGADVFLHWATDHPKHGKRATEILRHIELNEKAVTSSLSLWLFDKVMQDSEGYSLRTFTDLLVRLRNLKVVPLEVDHLRLAAEARQKFKVAPEVALAYAVAKAREATGVYSTNAEFEKTDLKREF